MHENKSALARGLGISRSTLYYIPKRPIADRILKDRILEVMAEHPAYGYRRVALALRVNKKRVQRVMRLFGLRPHIQRRRPRYGAKRDATGIPNRIAGLSPITANIIWAGDFTYLWYEHRFIYLATVIDLYTREIIAWQIGAHHTSALVIDTLAEAVRKRTAVPIIFHSDQGSEYASNWCLSWLITRGISPSHSPKGKPWHNGRQESFFSSFKLEFGKASRHTSITTLIEAIGRYIHYYNTRRIHGRLKMPPRVFFEKETGVQTDAFPTS